MKDADEIRTIVDENNNIIGYKKKKDMTEFDIYRTSTLWIKNLKGQVLLAQRAFDKLHNPGQWGPAVCGTIVKGETYDDNIIKEAEEEIGLKININDIQKVDLIKRMFDYVFFNQNYLGIFDLDIDDFKIQEEEIAQIKWWNLTELQEGIKNNPDMFLPNFWEIIEKIL